MSGGTIFGRSMTDRHQNYAEHRPLQDMFSLCIATYIPLVDSQHGTALTFSPDHFERLKFPFLRNLVQRRYSGTGWFTVAIARCDYAGSNRGPILSGVLVRLSAIPWMPSVAADWEHVTQTKV